jgi:hypothetical protein
MQKYLPDITCIIDPIHSIGALYIGNLEAAQDIKILKCILLLIKHIISKLY